jgi:hypothetical protein
MLAFATLSFWLAGCQEAKVPVAQAPAEEHVVVTYQNGKKITRKTRVAKRPAGELARANALSKGSSNSSPDREIRAIDQMPRSTGSSRGGSWNTGKSEQVAARQVTGLIKEAMDLGPTLAVWMFDNTASAYALTSEVGVAARSFYESTEMREALMADPKRLETAIVMFDAKPEFVVDPPATDVAPVKEALDNIKQGSGGRENTFAAIKAVLEKYGMSKPANQQMIVIVVTDEAGEDGPIADELVPIVKRQAIPIYVIGTPAPWGQSNPNSDGKKPANPDDDAMPNYGPESLLSERINLDFNGAGFGYGARDEFSLVNSGFGPFALEKLCRASGGMFLAIESRGGGRSMGYGGATTIAWPPGYEMKGEPDKMKKYAPDYVSVADYNKALAENKAKQALINAAKLGRVKVLENPDLYFPKARNEAEQKRQLDKAQQAPAKASLEVDKLYDVLAVGEGDRNKLTSPRWQAEFDLAMGRIMAAKVRIDGYNEMLAALKRGKNFENPGSTRWFLEAADVYEAGSKQKNMAEKAKQYLQRVVNEHPGTPWAKLAEQELKTPLGWKWRES